MFDRKLVSGAGLALAILVASAEVPGSVLPSGLEWGDDVKAIQDRLGKVEPDLCAGDERSYYWERGWSCEGMLKPGVRVGGSRFNVRLRMSQGGYRLANVNMLARVDGTKTDRVGRSSLLETCDGVSNVLASKLGSGRVTSEIVSQQAVRRIKTWVSEEEGTEVTVVCLERPENDFGEVMVDFAPISVMRGLI